VSPWSQGAAHRIGAALVHLADSLRESERPAGLNGDDALAYDEVLEEQAQSFESRGESAWQELLRNARDDDPAAARWIVATREQLFPRTAQRFLHRPAFDYPVLAANPGAELAGRGTALAPGK
jgi:hypothetical protein